MNIIPIEYKQAMNIEHGDVKWPCRFLFAFLFILNMAVNFNPYASSDFDALINYVYNGTEDLTSIYDLPITQGNIIYLVTISASVIITVFVYGIISAVLAKKYRIKNVDDEPSKDRIPLRKVIVWGLFILLVFIPFAFNVVYSLIAVIIILPGAVLLPAFYMNDNCNIFRSIGRTVYHLRRAYMKTLQVIILIYLTYYVVSLISNMLIYQFTSPGAIVLTSFASAWCWTALARFAGARYRVLKYMKGANPFQTPNQEGSKSI
jgi:hypothetical protein